MAQGLSATTGARARTRGVVLGKFLPPHRGHQFLIDFARHHCDHLTVLVCTLPNDPIPGELRYQWMREMFPQRSVSVVHVSEALPQTPEEHPEFWAIWRRVIHQYAPGGVDYFFASEDYGHRTAQEIGGGCVFVAVDQPRGAVPISATQVRSNPMEWWEFLPEPVRPYYLRRVCIFGPESTGKSTLARDLAGHFGTLHAQEYARSHLDPKGGKCEWEDIPRIAQGQAALEDALARQARKVLFCDTDALTTCLWSDLLFGRVPTEVQKLAEERTYDLYLLCDVDVPWVDDNQRFFSEQATRERIFARFKEALDGRSRPYVRLRGSWDERFATACEAVSKLLSKSAGGPSRAQREHS